MTPALRVVERCDCPDCVDAEAARVRAKIAEAHRLMARRRRSDWQEWAIAIGGAVAIGVLAAAGVLS